MRTVASALMLILLPSFVSIRPVWCDEPDASRATSRELDRPAHNTEKTEVHMNRLARESSPYLLLHAHNPVDWYPWGPEALEKARAENKLIFLSVGYSSCYWCHVMEREVFSNPKIAEYMNEHFVNIKVDREERPDIDDIYMTSLIVYQQAVGAGGGGGWPLSMFLTPDGHPVAGATYLPPEDSPDGRRGFMTAANTLVNVWKDREESVRKSGQVLAAEVRRLSGPEAIGETVQPTEDVVTAAVDAIKGLYDSEYGGVDHRPGRAGGPRFPNVPRLSLLLAFSQGSAGTIEARTEAAGILQHSLRAMAAGGIRDHLGGGFHRYSTDREWHVPHFEKMLYDQAQMLEIYARTALATNDPEFAVVAGEVADFVRREMTRPEGGFCSALDAETNTIEGEYYVWSREEVSSVLGETDAQVFMDRYSMLADQSFEHGYVLRLTAPSQSSTGNVADSPEMHQLKQKLLSRRSERKRPLLDDKVLTEWNGMMIQGLAISSQLPGRTADLEAAAKAADFVLTNLKDSEGHLLRSWRNDKAVYKAYLDDYAWMVSALLTLHEVTHDPVWLRKASQLNDEQIQRFYDPGLKTFFFTSDAHEELIARSSPIYDSVYPSGTSVSLLNLIRLSDIASVSKNDDSGKVTQYRQIVTDVLGRNGNKLNESPSGCSGLALVVEKLFLSESTEPAEAGDSEQARGDESPAGSSCGVLDDELPAKEETKTDPDEEDAETVSAFKPVAVDPVPGRGFVRDENDERPVTAKSFLYFDKLERGGQCPIAIELTMGENWHINANPAKPDFLKPTEVKISSKQKVKLTKVRYPKHEEFLMTGADEAYHVYSDRIIIYGLLEIDPSETASEAELEIKIDFQPCNSNECLPPEQIVLKGKVPVVNTGETLKKINEAKFKLLKPAEKRSEDEEAKEPQKDSE